MAAFRYIPRLLRHLDLNNVTCEIWAAWGQLNAQLERELSSASVAEPRRSKGRKLYAPNATKTERTACSVTLSGNPET